MGHAHDARDRRNVSDEIIVKSVKQGRVDRGGGPDHEQRITVCGCAHDGLNTDITAAPWAILDDELVAETLRQPLPYQARGGVVHGTGRKRDDDAYRPRRIGLRPSDAGDERPSDSTSDCNTQKLSSRYSPHLAHASLLQTLLEGSYPLLLEGPWSDPRLRRPAPGRVCVQLPLITRTRRSRNSSRSWGLSGARTRALAA